MTETTKRIRYRPLGELKIPRNPTLSERPVVTLDKKGYVKKIEYREYNQYDH